MAILAMLAAGCSQSDNSGINFQLDNYDYVNPLALQQRSSYAEAAQGRFASLADFENPNPKHDQSLRFSVNLSQGDIATALSPSSTGTASLAVKLPAYGVLKFSPENSWDLRPYTLLLAAIYIDHSRDDFVLRLKSAEGELLKSPAQVLYEGWNTVMVDISALSKPADAASKTPRLNEIEFYFTQASDTIEFNIDDILLVDNRRVLTASPENLTVSRHGLNFSISLFGLPEPLELKPNELGLFALCGLQPKLSLNGPDYKANNPNDITLMGQRHISATELVEANNCRVRLSSTWYFPAAHGAWIDLDVRRIDWDYCFYGDGRIVISALINNAGGQDIDTAAVIMPMQATWSDGEFGQKRCFGGFEDTVVEFSALLQPLDTENKTLKCGYNDPGTLVISTGSLAEGFDSTFDAKTGCYVASADNGNLRAVLKPASQPIVRPVLKIMGNWTSDVSVSCNGLSIPQVVVYDSYVLAVINEVISRDAILEVRGVVAGE